MVGVPCVDIGGVAGCSFVYIFSQGYRRSIPQGCQGVPGVQIGKESHV